jgi:hypothetical protein
MTQVIECLPGMCESLSLSPIPQRKSGTRQKMPTFTTFIQHSSGSLIQKIKARERNKIPFKLEKK